MGIPLQSFHAVPPFYTKMATISSRSVLGDITKLQNIPKKVALVDIGAKVVTRQTTSKKLHLDAALVDNGDASSDRSFPIGVADIDEKDLENPQLCAEYTQDVYAYLRKLEPSSAVRAGHLLGCSINDKMRAVLVDWLVEVQVQFKLLQETLFSTISIVDRFLAVEGRSVTRSKLQLVGVAAMFLASKVEEVFAPACSDFVYITDHAYTEDAIKRMEIKILQTLKFSLFEPSLSTSCAGSPRLATWTCCSTAWPSTPSSSPSSSTTLCLCQGPSWPPRPFAYLSCCLSLRRMRQLSGVR